MISIHTIKYGARVEPCWMTIRVSSVADALWPDGKLNLSGGFIMALTS